MDNVRALASLGLFRNSGLTDRPEIFIFFIIVKAHIIRNTFYTMFQ